MVYPIKTKEAVIKKVRMGGKPHHEIASEAGIGRSTLTCCCGKHPGHFLKIDKQFHINSRLFYFFRISPLAAVFGATFILESKHRTMTHCLKKMACEISSMPATPQAGDAENIFYCAFLSILPGNHATSSES